MAASNDNGGHKPGGKSMLPDSPDEGLHPLDEPLLLCSREDRWHDAALLVFLALTLIAALVGLIGTMIAASPT